MEPKANKSSNNNCGKKRRTFLLVVLLLLVFVCVAHSMLLQRNTLIDWWIPTAVCLPLACAAGWLLAPAMRAITAAESKAINILAGFILSLSVIVSAAYSLNFYPSKSDTSHSIETKVVNKYSEVRNYSEGRRSRRTKRTVYSIVIKLPDGRNKKFEVPVRDFNRYRIGDIITLHVEDGFLSVPVFKEMRLPDPERIHRKHRQQYGNPK